MSWKLIGTPKTQRATKGLAELFSTMDPCPHDRPLSERRLLVYERLWAKGEFRPITWASAYCKSTGGTYRVNGKHTSTMLAGALSKPAANGVAPPPPLFVTTEHYEADSLDDVGRLYGTFDSKMMARTANDIYASFAGCVTELKEVQVRNVFLAVQGMSYHLLGDSGHRKAHPPQKAEYLLEHAPFVVWLAALLPGRTNADSHLKRAAVAAAIFATYQKDSRDATKFWAEVRDETAPRPTEPSRKLAKYLVVNFSRVGKGKGGERIPDREIYSKCLHSWNAWRKGANTDLKYYPDADVPAAL